MGQESFLNKWLGSKSGNAKTTQLGLHLGIDVPLLLVTITLVVYGMIMVYSASYGPSFLHTDGASSSQMFNRQATWLGVGLFLMVAVIFIDYHLVQRFALLGMIVTIILLITVLVFGETSDGYSRNFLGGSYQPSEMAKLVTVIYLSVWMYSKRDLLGDFHFGLLPLSAILGIVGALILIQPDLSAAATVILLGAILFFVAGGDFKQLIIFIGAALLIAVIVVKLNPYGSDRIGSYLPGLKDTLASSDHVKRALSAFAHGGWFGVGLGKGSIKLTILPFPHTDSIFAVVGEEFGVMGAGFVLILFCIFLYRGLRIASRAPDFLGMLLASGIAIWIALEAFVNMLALTGLLPFAGNVLPFFSVGGSSLVFTLMGVGILLNISRLSEQKKLEEERRTFGALVDLRGRNGRRRVSRSSRSRTIKR